MENTPYASVFGSGTLASCPTGSAPFLCSMLPVSSTIPSMNNYGATAADSSDFNGCSAACYVGLMLGYTYGVSDGYSFSTVSGNPQFVNGLSSAGLTWQAYCESGCPRGNDHFPFSGANTFTGSSVSTSTFIAAANSASPPNFLWYTPTDSHNMHDVSVSTGDSYLKSFLVGSGSITSPASGSLLASNLFTSPNFRTVLYLWWDECGGNNGSCDSNNDAPNLLYGAPVKKAYVSPDTTGIDEYASLWTLESNWGLSPLAQGDAAAQSAGYQFTDIFASTTPLPLTASFTYLPTAPVAGTPVSFTAVASGGTAPYSYSWNFGDGSAGTGLTAAHTYASSGSFTIVLTVTDSTGGSAKQSQTLQVAPAAALTASFSLSPNAPVSGQTVTFTASASGGTSPYSYSWSLGGTTKTGNPVSQSFTNGTYTISLTVTDSAGKTATSSQLLNVQPASTITGSVPIMIGWGGVRMDESVAGSGGVASAVFPGEYASDMELLLIELRARGYNAVRVDFDPYCTDTVDYNYMSVYSQTNAQRAVQIAQHYGFWIILDYHGYSDIFLNTSCWLSYWKPIVQNIGPLYSNIVWEPENEPTLTCKNSPSSCPTTAPCSSDSSCVTYLGSAYQQWIDQARSLGDTHWIVVQNLCSYSCGFTDFSQGYPTVTDPLGTLSQGGKIFISLHSYMDYNATYTSWTNATAEAIADQYYQAVLAGVSNTGWPALNTEGGTDPLSCDPNICAPDTVLNGSAGYTVVTFHFIQTLVNLYDSNSPQRINWIWWPAGSWTNTPGAGTYGALQCNGDPIGWGCLLQTVPVTTGNPPVLSTSFTFTPNAPMTSQTVSFTASANGGIGPYAFSWSFGDGSTATGFSVSHSYSSAGSFTVKLTAGDSGSPQQVATSQQVVSVANPPPKLAVTFGYSPSSPKAGQQITFTASISGGTSPYSLSWSFGDGGSSTSNPATHVYSSSGSFVVTVTAIDSSGANATSSQTLMVAAPLAVSFSNTPTSPEATSPVTFTATSTGGVGSPVFSWTFGDGSSSSSNPVNHTYSSSGTFTVTVTGIDTNGVKAVSSQKITVTSALGVSFTENPSSLLANQSVVFTATTTGGVGGLGVSWDFGDGSTSTANPATHTYTSSGSYTVTITATDSDGVKATSGQTITVAAVLSDSFTLSPSSPEVGQLVSFAGSASGGASPYSYSWSFGDGSTGTGQSATHTYSSAGSFNVVLTVKDSGSPQQKVSSQLSIVVFSPPPVLTASFSYSPSTPETGQTVWFIATAGGGTSPYSYSWSFGDGTTGTGSSVAHSYSSSGSFIVTLNIQDSGSPQQTATSQQTISVSTPPQPLSANFTDSPLSPQTGQQVTFTGSASGGTSPYSFSWSYGDGSTGTGSSTSHTYSTAGTYIVSLTITDNGAPQQTATSKQTINVTSPPAPLSVAFTFNPASPHTGEEVGFNASVSGGTGPYNYSWTFGGGSIGSGSSVTHTYLATGSFTVILTVTDSGLPQQTANYSATISVTPTPPQPTSTSVTCPSTGTVGEGLTCTATVIDNASGSNTVPTGLVYFTPSGDCSLFEGSCSVNITSSVSGTLFVSASYGGDSQNLASTSATVNISISNRETSTAITCVPSILTIGQTATCSATVTDTSPGTALVPSGNVTFSYGGSCALSGTGVSASCSTSISPTNTGQLTISASYIGDTAHNASSGTVMEDVEPLPTPTLSADFVFAPVNPAPGQMINFTAVATGGLSPYAFSWNFGDGSAGSGNSTSHAYVIAQTYNVVLVVTDANNTTFEVARLLVVVSPNPTIVLTVPANQTVDEGSSLTFNVTAIEDSSRQISLACESCFSIGANFTTSLSPSSAIGVFSWTPSEARGSGSYSIEISATDGTQFANATISITVVDVEAPLVLQAPGSFTARQGETVQFQVNVTDPDALADSVTLTATGLPDGASFDPTTGTFYWPIQGVQPGVYSLTFTATDNETPASTATATVIVHVDNGNGRCFVCQMFQQSQLTLNTSPLTLVLRILTTLLSSLAVVTLRYGAGWWRKAAHKKERHSQVAKQGHKTHSVKSLK